MSDLQCPAIIVMLTPEALEHARANISRLSAVVAAASLEPGSRALGQVQRLAAGHGCQVERADLDDAAALSEHVEQLADLYRGETVAVIAPTAAVCAALRHTAAADRPIAIAVDSSGWKLLPS